MRVDGSWRVCEDGIVRPVLRAEVRTQGGEFVPVYFLVDSGADRTVFSANLLQSLEIPSEESTSALRGVGGKAESVTIPTKIRVANRRLRDI
jgi:hypothetical protein